MALVDDVWHDGTLEAPASDRWPMVRVGAQVGRRRDSAPRLGRSVAVTRASVVRRFAGRRLIVCAGEGPYGSQGRSLPGAITA